MKKIFFIASLMMISTFSNSAADKMIRLPKHDLSKIETTIKKTFDRRHSVREFAETDLRTDDLSNLLWAADGYNRIKEQKRTAPSAMNRQEVNVYVVSRTGIYLYDAKEETLVEKVKGDFRKLVAHGQDFVNNAPLSILLSADISKLGNPSDTYVKYMAAVDIGIVTENICLYCAAAHLANVPRATMDVPALKQLLGLDDNQLLLMNVTVGYYTPHSKAPKINN